MGEDLVLGDLPIPKVSVCLPTYNRAHYLSDTINSVLGQTFEDFELVVVDNCSTDATPDVVAAFDDPRVRYVRHDANIGHYRNMNRGLALCRGEYACIVHDDDVYAPEFLARESDMLDRHSHVGMVHCAVYEVDPDRRPIRLHRVFRRTRIAEGRREFVRYLGGHDVSCSTVMCRLELWRRAGPFVPELMCADWLMWLNLALLTDVAYIAVPLVETRVHGTSMTSMMDPLKWYDEYIEVTRRAIDNLRRSGIDTRQSVDVLPRWCVGRQSQRFLTAALAAAAADAESPVQGYLEVLDRLRARGASPVYSVIGRLLAHRAARPLLRLVRRARRGVAHAIAARGTRRRDGGCRQPARATGSDSQAPESGV